MQTADRRLMWHGVFLFLIGLVTGLQERRFKNMRMALSAHLEGVMNGTFLIALGAIWGHVELPPRVEQAARWTALFGTYGNWLFTTLGAAMGTAAANPILSQGHHGKPWQEKVAGTGFRSIAYSILIAVVLILWGPFPSPTIVGRVCPYNGRKTQPWLVRNSRKQGDDAVGGR